MKRGPWLDFFFFFFKLLGGGGKQIFLHFGIICIQISGNCIGEENASLDVEPFFMDFPSEANHWDSPATMLLKLSQKG